MADNFNAREQANKMEDVGYELLHNALAGDFSWFSNELSALSPLQAEALNTQLKWNSWKPTNDPNVEMHRNENGQIKALSFTPSIFDTTARIRYVLIGIGKSDRTQNPQ